MSETITFGQWLRAQRRAAGKMSQQELADRVGVHRTHIVKLETGGIHFPGDELRERIHRVFGTTDSDLFDAKVSTGSFGWQPSWDPKIRQPRPYFEPSGDEPDELDEPLGPDDVRVLNEFFASGAKNLSPQGKRLLVEQIKLIRRLYGIDDEESER